MDFPILRKETKQIEHGSAHAKWIYLTVGEDHPSGGILGELHGKIGHMTDYCKNESNRWDYLRHPLPFVFFHPHLPIYIDTREEGNTLRYLRRSCNPTLKMMTFLEGSDYHFCFVATRDLEAGTELTIPWTLDQHVRSFLKQNNPSEQIQENDRKDYEEKQDKKAYVSKFVERVLADFGECACGLAEECSFFRWDNRNRDSFIDPPLHTPAGWKNKRNARYGSEGADYADEEDDNRSTSGSIKSKPQSRDLTPSAPGLDISIREKRKIARLEKEFGQLDQDKVQPAKKKKRSSAGSALNTPAANTEFHFSSTSDRKRSSTSQPNTPGVPKSKYTDNSTSISGRKATTGKMPNAVGSRKGKVAQNHAHSPVEPSPLQRNYVDASTQVDMDDEEETKEVIEGSVEEDNTEILTPMEWMFKLQRRRFAEMEELQKASLAQLQVLGEVSAGIAESTVEDVDGDISMQDVKADPDPLLPKRR
jgi:hypothetical protein